MTKLFYDTYKPGADARLMIARAGTIAAEYAAQGYSLTLRQIYYQFVARGFIPNTQKSYDRLGEILNRARMGGFFDWAFMIDRTRNLEIGNHWTSPRSILQAAADGYAIDKWGDQPYHVEVWVEKEALADVVGQAATTLDVGYLACRGYMSQSEQWAAGQRFLKQILAGKQVLLLHLGDHDPSGLDMTRDIDERLHRFLAYDYPRHHPDADGSTFGAVFDAIRQRNDWTHYTDPIEVRRIALTMDQVEQYQPPPNPAKTTDARFVDYQREYGDESWELDALEPQVITNLINDEVLAVREDELWEAALQLESEGRDYLRRVADEYEQE